MTYDDGNVHEFFREPVPSVLGVLVEVGVELVAVEPPVGGGETLLGRLAGAWGACVGDPAGQVGVGLPCGAEGDACGGVSPGPVGADDDGSALFLALMSAILWAPVLGTFLGFPANAANIHVESFCLFFFSLVGKFCQMFLDARAGFVYPVVRLV